MPKYCRNLMIKINLTNKLISQFKLKIFTLLFYSKMRNNQCNKIFLWNKFFLKWEIYSLSMEICLKVKSI